VLRDSTLRGLSNPLRLRRTDSAPQLPHNHAAGRKFGEGPQDDIVTRDTLYSASSRHALWLSIGHATNEVNNASLCLPGRSSFSEHVGNWGGGLCSQQVLRQSLWRGSHEQSLMCVCRGVSRGRGPGPPLFLTKSILLFYIVYNV